MSNNVATYARLLNVMRKMAAGTMGGQSKVATPPAAPTTARVTS